MELKYHPMDLMQESEFIVDADTCITFLWHTQTDESESLWNNLSLALWLSSDHLHGIYSNKKMYNCLSVYEVCFMTYISEYIHFLHAV